MPDIAVVFEGLRRAEQTVRKLGRAVTVYRLPLTVRAIAATSCDRCSVRGCNRDALLQYSRLAGMSIEELCNAMMDGFGCVSAKDAAAALSRMSEALRRAGTNEKRPTSLALPDNTRGKRKRGKRNPYEREFDGS